MGQHMEQEIKTQIKSVLVREIPIEEKLIDIIDNTQFVRVEEHQMVQDAGKGECLFLLGNVCYYTDSFLKLPPKLKACYYLTEWHYQGFYIRGKHAESACWAMQYEEEGYFDMYPVTKDVIQLFSILGLIISPQGCITSNRLYLKYLAQLEDFKVNLERVLTNEPNEQELKDCLAACYDVIVTSQVFYTSEQEENFIAQLPKLTVEKAKSYLKRLLIDQDSTLGDVTYHLELDEFISFTVEVTRPVIPYQVRKIRYDSRLYDAMLYSRETGMLHVSGSKLYNKFYNQTKLLRELKY